MLTDSLILVTLKTKMFGDSHKDADLTDVATHHAQARPGEIETRKSLLGKGALASIRSSREAAKNAHEKHSSPWLNRGQRIINTIGYDKYIAAVSPRIDIFNGETTRFCDEVYPELREARRAFLGSAYNSDDYPDPSIMRDNFNMTIIFQPCPDTRDWRLKMAEEQASAIREKAIIDHEAALQGAHGEAVGRTVELLKHMADALSGYEKGPDGKANRRLHKSLVGNVLEMAEILPGLNLTGDTNLNELAHQIQRDLNFDIDDLKDNKPLRDSAVNEARDIIRRLSGEEVSW